MILMAGARHRGLHSLLTLPFLIHAYAGITFEAPEFAHQPLQLASCIRALPDL